MLTEHFAKPYDDNECHHARRFDNHGVDTCKDCGAVYNVDHKTIHQRIQAGLLKVKKEKAENNYVKRMLVSVRDLADMIIEKPLKPCSGKPARRYTPEEIAELKTTGKVVTRSYDSYKVKAHRLGYKLRDIRRNQQILPI